MDVSQYLDIFIDETSGHIQSLSDNIMELEKEPDNKDVVNISIVIHVKISYKSSKVYTSFITIAMTATAADGIQHVIIQGHAVFGKKGFEIF